MNVHDSSSSDQLKANAKIAEDNNNNNSEKMVDNNDTKSVKKDIPWITYDETGPILDDPDSLGAKMTVLLYEYFGIKFKAPIKWFNSIFIIVFHVFATYTMLAYFFKVKILTFIWGFLMGGVGGFGVTAGVHRLWCHRAYKAKLPLRIILMVCYSLAGQNTIFDWVRDHRIHHKFSETDADPHNSNRGFFFAHVGWLMLKKHPECIKKGRATDMSDITSDPVVQWHQRHFTLMKILCCFVLPTFVPWYFWNESFKLSFYSQCLVRYMLGLNFTWSVNSAAHLWGKRPYDKRINPVENLSVAIVAMGEGWHNYHHVFPWDYKAAELGNYKFNITTFWLDMFAKIGWAYDMKEPSKDIIKRTITKYGDGTHWGNMHVPEVPDPEENGKIINNNNNIDKTL